MNDKDLKSEENSNDLTVIILYSIIIGLNFFIFSIIICMIVNTNKGLIISLSISIIIIIISFIYQYYLKRKNLIIASLLNVTPLMPVGLLYTTQKFIPKSLNEIIFAIVHVFTSFMFILSPMITFISGLINKYPVKEGYTLSIL